MHHASCPDRCHTYLRSLTLQGGTRAKNDMGDTVLMGPFTFCAAFLSRELRAGAPTSSIYAHIWPKVAVCPQEGCCSELPDGGPGLCLPGLGVKAATYFLLS